METKLINGSHQFVFSDEEKQEIYDLFVNNNYSCRQLQRKFNCSQKPMRRVLDELGLDYSKGNLTGFKYNFENGIYDENYENEVRNKISSIPFKEQKHSVNQYYFDDLRNPEVIYTLGFLYADGNNTRTFQAVNLILEEHDKTILEKINSNINNSKELRYVDNSNKHDFGYTYKNQFCLCIQSKRISLVLNELGIVPNKSLILEFPKWLHPSLYNHFLRGVFDGDGSIYRYERKESTPTITVTITSTENFCKAIVDICAKYLKIRGRIYDASCHNGITKVFTLSGCNISQQFLEWLYQDATIFLQRKYNRYCEYYNINNPIID